MSSNQQVDLSSLRCPSCSGRRLCAPTDTGGDVWVSCPDCTTDFVSHEGIPFLTTRNFFDLVAVSENLDLQDENVDQFDGNTVKQANIAFHNQFADKYEGDVSTFDIFRPDGPCQRRLTETLSEAARESSGGMLLDVCCGTGNVLLAAKPFFDNCLGIDISVNMMAIAQERGLKVLGGDATNIPLADDSADCVTAFSALHHIVDYPSTAAEMARVLKPGGTFYSDWDPNGHVTHTGWAVSLAVNTIIGLRRLVSKGQIPETPEQRAAEFHHHSMAGFDPEKVAHTLRAAGFRKVEVIYHVNPPSFSATRRWTLSLLAMAALKIVSFVAPVPQNLYPWVAVLGIK